MINLLKKGIHIGIGLLTKKKLKYSQKKILQRNDS